MTEQLLSVKYRGPAITESGMDARQVSDAIRGFSDFSMRVGLELFGDDVKQRSTIRSISPGSIVIDFVQWFSDDTVQLGIAAAIDAQLKLPELISWCFSLVKHLRGQPAKSIKYEGDRGCLVENNEGEVNNFHIAAVNIVLDPKTGNALRKFGKKPLDGGANEISVIADDEVIATAKTKEADYFVPVGSEEALIDQTVEMRLIVAATVFEGRGHWRFFDGSRTFPVEIEDEEFLRKIDLGQERFGKGDVLLVRLRTVQKLTRSGLRAEYTILKVLDHQTPQQIQVGLF